MNDRETLETVHPNVRAASIFAAPVMLDKEATVEKTCQLIKEAAENGAELAVFPESFIPGFPVWTAFRKPVDGHAFFKRFATNSLSISGPEIARIAAVARDNKIFVSLGESNASAPD